jgi:radical SAM protein with 4Fe4S-binding SPASM domain
MIFNYTTLVINKDGNPILENNADLENVELESKYLLIKSDWDLILENIRKKGVIYNLYTGDIYAIESPYSEIVHLCENERMTINEAISKLNITDNRSKEKEISNFINELVELDLGELYDKKIFIEKIRPVSTKKQKLIRDEPPLIKFLWLKINNVCNLKCVHCFNETELVEKCGCYILQQYSNNHHLEMNQWKQILDEAALFNCQAVHFIGGEPLLMLDKLLTMIEYAKFLRIPSISLSTNGLLLNSDVINKLVREDVHFVIPFYSWRQEIHDSITGVQGSYEKVLSAIKQIQSQNGSLNVEILILKKNQNDVLKTKEFLKSLEIEKITTQILKSNRKDLFANKYKFKAYRTKETFSKISRNQFFSNREGHPCLDGKVANLFNGDVLPCIMAYRFCLDNVINKSFRQIIRTSGLMGEYWDLTKDKIDVCRDCEFRYACSDCRVIESIDGSLTGKNKFCTYNPSTGIWGTL